MTAVDFFSYNQAMKKGRPRKKKSERKDFDLRIPMTSDQKELIQEAATLRGEDMAGWARPILLRAAQAELRGGADGGEG